MFMWGASSFCVCASLIWKWECFGNEAFCRPFWTPAPMASSRLLHLPAGMGKHISMPCPCCALWACSVLRVATKTQINAISLVPVPGFYRKGSWPSENRKGHTQLSQCEWLGKAHMVQLTPVLLFKHIQSLFSIALPPSHKGLGLIPPQAVSSIFVPQVTF